MWVRVRQQIIFAVLQAKLLAITAVATRTSFSVTLNFKEELKQTYELN